MTMKSVFLSDVQSREEDFKKWSVLAILTLTLWSLLAKSHDN